MATLATLWKANNEVCLCTNHCSGDVAVTCSGDVPAVFRPFVRTPIGTNRFQQFGSVFSGNPAHCGQQIGGLRRLCASLESVPHSPPPFLSFFLSSAPQHGRSRVWRYAGHIDCLAKGDTKHAGGCVCMHACEFVHHAPYAVCDVCIMVCHGREWPLLGAEG